MDETVSHFISYSKELPANWRKFYPAQIRNKSGILLHLKRIVHQTAIVPTITAYQLRQAKQWKFAQNLCICKVIDRLTLIHCLILKHKFVLVGNVLHCWSLKWCHILHCRSLSVLWHSWTKVTNDRGFMFIYKPKWKLLC